MKPETQTTTHLGDTHAYVYVHALCLLHPITKLIIKISHESASHSAFLFVWPHNVSYTHTHLQDCMCVRECLWPIIIAQGGWEIRVSMKVYMHFLRQSVVINYSISGSCYITQTHTVACTFFFAKGFLVILVSMMSQFFVVVVGVLNLGFWDSMRIY